MTPASIDPRCDNGSIYQSFDMDISWPLSRSDHFKIIPTHHYAKVSKIPFIHPKPAGAHPLTPAHRYSSRYSTTLALQGRSWSHRRQRTRCYSIPDGTCSVCRSPYTRPLKGIPGNSLELGFVISPLSWIRLQAWAHDKEDRERAEREEGARNAEEHEGNLHKRTAEVLRRRKINRPDETTPLARAMDVERQIAVQRLQRGTSGNQKRGSGRNERAGMRSWTGTAGNAEWTLWLLPREDDEDNEKNFDSLKLHVKLEIGLGNQKLGNGTSLERKAEVSPCLSKARLEDWDMLRRRCLGGSKIDCVFVDAGRSFCLEVQVRALHRVNHLERIVRRRNPYKKETMKERLPNVYLCVNSSANKTERDRQWELQNHYMEKRKADVRREIERRRKAAEQKAIEKERQIALDRLEGRPGSSNSADSEVDLAAIFENLMVLGRRREPEEEIISNTQYHVDGAKRNV